jgi:hypothetical protein
VAIASARRADNPGSSPARVYGSGKLIAVLFNLKCIDCECRWKENKGLPPPPFFNSTKLS